MACSHLSDKSLSDRKIDQFTDSPKPLHYIPVRNTHNKQIFSLQKRCAFLIVFNLFRFAMLRTVQFNSQLGFMTIKIYDIVPKRILPMYRNRV